MERLISLLGLFVMILLAWLLSARRNRVSLRVIVGGLCLQLVFATLTLKTIPGLWAFDQAGKGINALMEFVKDGTRFVFNMNGSPEQLGGTAPNALLSTLAFGVLPTIIFFSALMSVLYYIGIMPRVVKVMAWIMARTLGTSGAESLSAASNIFVGQTEAPLVIRPFVGTMTQSELMAVMTGGFATVAGGVMAVYISAGIDATHLLTASVISAPAALLIAKVMQPEVDTPVTLGSVEMSTEQGATNVFEALAIGAKDGMYLAINVTAMLIAFTAMVALVNALLGWSAMTFFGYEKLTMQTLLGYAFYPFAWLMGIERNDCFEVGQLLGTRTVLNELIAYEDLGAMLKQPDTISQRSAVLTTYALCGFANFSSIGIQIGGIGALAPNRQGDLARLGLRAMVAGTLACFMTACVAGLLI